MPNPHTMDAGARGILASLPDRELVLAFQAGEEDAFEHLYQRHRAKVTVICRKMLGNRSDAEEAAQETFLRAFEALPRFNGSFQVGSWFARIATNVCIDHLRRRGRADLVELPTDGDQPSVDEGPESQIAGRDQLVRRAIREIEPTHARALVMRNQGLSHREIGERMAMRPAQVKALLHRARRSLRLAWGKAQGRVLAPAIGMRAAVSGDSGTASDACGDLAGQAVSAAPLIGGKVAVVMVAATLSGLPADDLRREPAPAPRLSSATEVEVQRGNDAARPPVRASLPAAGERPVGPVDRRRGDLTTTVSKSVAVAAPDSEPHDDDGAERSREQRVPEGTSEGPSVLQDARKVVDDLTGS